MKSRWLSVLIISVLLFGGGCVYYNTFFHARQAYKEAEDQRRRSKQDVARGAAAQKYSEAIKKASKVLQNHPKSKYADDAILLIGKSFYHTGEYMRAKEKFVELSTVFRESSLLPEARFYLGMCEYYLDNPEKARETLESIAREGKVREFRDLAQFMLGRIPYEEEKYDEALPMLRQYVTSYPNSENTIRADSMLASSFWELEQYDSARAEFAHLATQTDEPELKYHALYRRSEAAYRLGDYTTGLAEFRKLEGEDQYFSHVGMLRYQVGIGLRALDSVDEALEIFRKLPEDFAKSEEASRALFEMGEIYEDRGESLSVAQGYFAEISKTWTRDQEFATEAVKRANEIGRLLSLQQTITGEDSTRFAQSHFQLGTLYLRQMGEPDSALQQFRLVVDDYPESEYATPALLNIAELLLERDADSARAEQVWQTLVARYPAGEAAMWARTRLGMPLPEDITKSDILLLRGAESVLLDAGDPDSATKLYDLLLQEYPDSRYRAKAIYSKAWILDHYYANDDSAVYYAYKTVVDSFPTSPYAADARKKLNPPERQVRSIVTEKTDTAKTDTTYIDTSAVKTTIAELQDTTVLAPKPIQLGEFEYPPPIPGFIWRDNVRVTFLIHINDQGEVEEDLKLIGSSGYTEIDLMAKEAVKKTRFNPQDIDNFLLITREWFKYELVIPPPGQAKDEFTDPFFDQGQQ